jgi:hypothetical protein
MHYKITGNTTLVISVRMAAMRYNFPSTRVVYPPCSKLDIIINSFHLLEFQRKVLARKGFSLLSINYVQRALIVNVDIADGATWRTACRSTEW